MEEINSPIGYLTQGGSRCWRKAASQLFVGLTRFAQLETRIAALPDEKTRGDTFEVFAGALLIPESFREGMADIAAGRVVDLDEALSESAVGAASL